MVRCKLKSILADRKIRAQDFGSRIGMNPSSISFLMNDKAKSITFAQMEAICRELGLTLNDVFEITAG